MVNLKAYKTILFFGLISMISSCNFFNSGHSKEYVARVHDTYLEKKEVEKAIPKNLKGEDSIIFVNNYINRWATDQLLLEGARINLSQEKQNEFNTMVKEYQKTLYSEAYKDMIIANRMDTLITDQEIEEYFNSHESNFKLNENLVKLRYIQLPADYPDADDLKENFIRFNEEDREEFEKESIKFESFSFNDSIWVQSRTLQRRIPPLKDERPEVYLKKDKFIELNDSLSLYLIFIKEVLSHNEQAPLSYVKPTVKQILLNKRKLKFEKRFKKDITKDALEENTFEIYK